MHAARNTIVSLRSFRPFPRPLPLLNAERIDVVRYDQINAMLLNEFLKEHKKVEEQQPSIAEQ